MTIDRERVNHWVGKGAKLSNTVRTLLARHVTAPASAPDAASASARAASADKTAVSGTAGATAAS